MRKHFLLLMLLSLLPLAGFAAAITGTVQENGKGLKFKVLSCYKTTTETHLNTVEVSQADWVTNADDKTSLVIPEKVSFAVVGEDDEAASVNQTIEFTVVKIANAGFANLSDLESVTIPASVEEIGTNAFSDDYSLSTLLIATGSKLKTIGNYAFSAWISETFDLSSATSLTTLPVQLFLADGASQNPYVKNVVLPTSITDINTALAKLPNLASVNIAATKLASLEEGALEGNTKITALELPATCLVINDGALKSTKVAELTINANQAGTTQTIGDGVKSIYGTEVADLKVLTTLHIVGEFKGTIAANAFAGLGELASIDMDDISGTITAGAFTGANAKLATIELGNIKDGATIQAAFASTLPAGAALTIGNIGNATIAENAFTGLKSVAIGDIATATTPIGNGAFSGAKLASISLGNILGARIGTGGAGVFASTLGDGAALTIGNIGAAAIAANAFTGLKSVTIGDIVLGTMGTGAFAGAKLASINIGNINGSIGDSFASTLATGASLTIASIGADAALVANSFTKIKSLTITDGISDGTIAEGSFVFVDANNQTANLGAISGGVFAANAITGPTTAANKLTLTIGNVSAALSNNLATGAIKEATVGEISAPVKLNVFGAAEKIVFGDIKTGGSLSLTGTADNATLAEVNFGAIEVAAGIAAGTFDYSTKLKTVKFNGLLADGAVAALSFDNAGSAVAADGDGYKLFVTYLPETLTKPFAETTFGEGGDPVEVKLSVTQAFFENYNVETGGDITWFKRARAIFTKAPITKVIEFKGEVAPDGYKYARFYVSNGESAVFDKPEGVTAYSAYVDGTDIYMNPLRAYGRKYEINGAHAIRAAIIVKSKSGDDITVTMNPETPLTKQSIQNYDDNFGILYNDLGVALTGAKISMENTNFFKLTDGATAVNWATLQTNPTYANNNAIVLLSNPAKSKYIKFADFDPTSQPSVKIADGGYYLLTAKAPAAAPRQVIWLDDMGNATAIEAVEKAVEDNNGNNVIYNIAGQKVSAGYKGLVIKNGKKFIQK